MVFSSLKHSIARKLLTVVFTLYTLVTLTVTAYHLYLDYLEADNRIRDDLQFYSEIVLPSIAEGLWNFNHESVQSALEGIVKSPSVLGARVTDIRNDHWYAGYTVDPEDGKELIFYNPQSGEVEGDRKREMLSYESIFRKDNKIIYTDPTGEKFIIGTLMLTSSSAIVFQEVEHAFMIILFNAVIKVVALWALFLSMGYYYLTKPLNALTSWTKKICGGELDLPALPTDSSWKTEIEILNENFNGMMKELSASKGRLLSAQERTKDIIDSMPSVIIGLTADGRITDWNTAAEKFTDVKAKHAIERPISHVYEPYQILVPLVKEAIEHDAVKKIPKQSVHIRAKRHFQEILVYPIAASDHQEGAVVRIDDVTMHVHMESAMIQKEKMSSVGALAAGMAHEINNPLGAIVQGVQNIERRMDDKLEANQECAQELSFDLEKMHVYLQKRKIDTFIKTIRESRDRASHIVENLLQFSRPSNIVKARCSFEEICDKALQLAKTDYDLKKNLDFKKIAIKQRISPDLPAIYGSPIEIEQVLINIFKNAAQAMHGHTAKPEITIKMIAVTLEKEYLELTITDNGPGVPTEDHKRLFEPFYSTKELGQGTGLGLAVSYKIIEAHDGQIEASSDGSSGTSFIIRLPVATHASGDK